MPFDSNASINSDVLARRIFIQFLDTSQTVELPEGVDIQLHLAGPMVRALAWTVDFLIRLVVYIAALILFFQLSAYFSSRLLTSFFLMAFFGVEWFYPVAFECWNKGATPGKRWLKIKVLQANGSPVSLSSSMIRNLLRVADFFPLLYGAGLVCMLFDPRFRRLGDLAAGTVVIYAENVEKKTKFVPPCSGSSALPILITQEEQQSIVRFAELTQHLAKERQIELAELLFPLTRLRGEEAVTHLCEVSNELLGYR